MESVLLFADDVLGVLRPVALEKNVVPPTSSMGHVVEGAKSKPLEVPNRVVNLDELVVYPLLKLLVNLDASAFSESVAKNLLLESLLPVHG